MAIFPYSILGLIYASVHQWSLVKSGKGRLIWQATILEYFIAGFIAVKSRNHTSPDLRGPCDP